MRKTIEAIICLQKDERGEHKKQYKLPSFSSFYAMLVIKMLLNQLITGFESASLMQHPFERWSRSDYIHASPDQLTSLLFSRLSSMLNNSISLSLASHHHLLLLLAAIDWCSTSAKINLHSRTQSLVSKSGSASCHPHRHSVMILASEWCDWSKLIRQSASRRHSLDDDIIVVLLRCEKMVCFLPSSMDKYNTNSRNCLLIILLTFEANNKAIQMLLLDN